jgi:hypothetical protein
VVTFLLFAVAGSLIAQETTPLSLSDKARVEQLLRNFDPNSYSLDIPYVDNCGNTHTAKIGNAVGLRNLKQTSVERRLATAASASTNTNNNIFVTRSVASTNTNNNIFRVASTNTNNNIFRVDRLASTNTNNNIFRVASTNTNNNIFVNDRQAAAARELNAILQKAVAP